MPVEVIFPKVDMDMSSGTIADWHISAGETVKKGDALFDIETDKATMEVESPGTGTLHFVRAKQGDVIAVGQVIAWIFAENEQVIAPEGVVPGPSDMPNDMPDPTAEAPENGAGSETARVPNQRQSLDSGGTRATPLARRVAQKRGIDLAHVSGSGPRGRITRADVAAVPQNPGNGNVALQPVAINASGKTGAEQTARELGLGYTATPVSKMRSVIARRLTESNSTVPHFYLNADVAIDALLTMRAQMNAALAGTGAKKISVNDLLIKACAAALKAVPEANASWDGDTIIKYDDAHISVAVAIAGGLVTPFVRNAQKKDIQTISAEIADLVERAKTGKLSSKEYQGGSFSLSNLGMYGVKSFNAIINPPESMILAVGQGTQQFVPDTQGNPRSATIMHVCLSCDHRVVDGILGAVWLKKFRQLIENPAAMMLN